MVRQFNADTFQDINTVTSLSFRSAHHEILRHLCNQKVLLPFSLDPVLSYLTPAHARFCTTYLNIMIT